MAKKVNDVSFEEAFQFIRKVGLAAHKYGSTSGRLEAFHNGQLVLRNGELQTDVAAGKPIRR